MNSSSELFETADIETSSDEYARRFSGSAGQWMLDVQERIALGFIQDTPGCSILDVGGGHGQLAIPLVRRGFPVTVLGSAESCASRLAEALESGRCSFLVGNVVALPFPDRSFDTVICFRLLTHCRRWPLLISELCRVARHSVIVDYPTSQSLNRIAPTLFQAKKRLEGNTRPWTLFRHAEILKEFEKAGYRRHRKQAQFFLPMVLHRALKSRKVSAFLEKICDGLGLTSLWGSPAIVGMVRSSGNKDV